MGKLLAAKAEAEAKAQEQAGKIDPEMLAMAGGAVAAAGKYTSNQPAACD